MQREMILRRRIRWLTWFFIFGLFVSGVTAIPLQTELVWLTRVLGFDLTACEEEMSSLGLWLMSVRHALDKATGEFPFLFYGTDWLAFGHFVIAIAFIGALRDPVRNRWLFDFGLIACVLIAPYALIFGGLRGIPIWWRLIDCSFGLFGFIPLWLCRRWTGEMEQIGKK